MSTAAVPAVERFPVRVMVTPVWDHVLVQVDGSTTIRRLKRDALQAALKRADLREDEFLVKYRGATMLDESVTLGALRAGRNAPFIVLPARRQPVR